MPEDVSKQSPMIAQAGVGGPGSETATDRAQAMRARLGVQREAEELLSQASKLRQSAAADADIIVAEAETLATQLVTEARETADRLAIEGQERADGILARARLEADDLQRHTDEERARIRDEVLAVGRAEIEEFRTRSAGLLDEAEGRLRQLAPSLEDAVATVVEALRSLEELRNGGTDEKPGALELSAGTDTGPAADVRAVDDAEAMVAEGAPAASPDDPDARPLGWLFRASQG